MYEEVPEFKRCCFCLPLRIGLIGWGYFRVALDVLAIIHFVLMYIHYGYLLFYSEFMIIIAVIIYYFIDAVFTMFLIVGGHKKNHMLLRISYIYCIVWLAFILILGGFVVYIEIYWIQMKAKIEISSYGNLAWDLGILFIAIIVQVYVILLSRSEEIKLRKEILEVQFVNNAADAESISVRTSTNGPTAC